MPHKQQHNSLFLKPPTHRPHVYTSHTHSTMSRVAEEHTLHSIPWAYSITPNPQAVAMDHTFSSLGLTGIVDMTSRAYSVHTDSSVGSQISRWLQRCSAGSSSYSALLAASSTATTVSLLALMPLLASSRKMSFRYAAPSLLGPKRLVSTSFSTCSCGLVRPAGACSSRDAETAIQEAKASVGTQVE